MDIFGDLTAASGFFLILALGMALAFEFVNGFHDTANAVATVIYTHSLKPTYAVIWSGLFNLLGVLTSTGAVAFGIIALLPVELVLNAGSGAGFAMVFSLLISAIIWNLGTWYLGLPASSSHTLIGSILGVGLANSLIRGAFGEGVNWAKAQEIFTSLLLSPLIGFVCAALLLLLAKALIHRPELYQSPEGRVPPLWIRALLMFTCTGVSFAHGSNDGQKGMGLIMLILIGIVPSIYALDLNTDVAKLVTATQPAIVALERQVVAGTTGTADDLTSFLRGTKVDDKVVFATLAQKAKGISDKIAGKASFKEVSPDDRRALRSDIYLVGKSIAKLDKQKKLEAGDAKVLKDFTAQLGASTEFIPSWVKTAVAFTLGLGTMVGWKRIVVTVGEKIGKSHLTYAQGASAELVAMCTIAAADHFGLPVSTTHVLSSGVAGTMAANHSGLQMDTLRNLLLAWVLTLPVCILLGSMTFSGGLFLLSHVFGIK